MTNGSSNALSDLRSITAEALAALDTGHQISPFSARFSAFDLDDAYHVAAAIRQMREARGEMPVGRKIGFTNRTIWAEYNVYGPIWGYVYDRTVHNLAEIGDTFSLMGLAEPRIEPEIVFKLALARTWTRQHCWLASTGSGTASKSWLSRMEVFSARHGRGVRP